ncbi:hypothetical protein [Nodosilinea sp. E11]|uniref:hypothetical protein n=1 Tax=Nodosilinea sp. E11 TaxID=3037479 RepID=UPI0029342153|nr:hypothetical protein [Nodosilinea sp. E11]WOD37089.1 hypothetical protein RRF56_01115 [Nodosilinea sp. E11]
MPIEYYQAKPFQAFEVFGDRIQFLLGILAGKLGSDLGDGPVAGGGAEQVADGGKAYIDL